MKVPKEIFRMYDIRGIADRDITEDFAFNLGRAFGKIVRENGGKAVSVGMDVRPTSPKYKAALVDGFRQTGLDVYDIGVVPTPLQYYSLYKLPVDGGIQVTASHNPREYNGFKISLGKYSFFGEGIQRLRIIIEKEEFLHLFERGKHIEEDMVDPYVDEMVKNVNIKGKIKVAIDAGNGTAGPVITQILDELKVPYDGIYLEPDGNFPNHLPDPTVVEYMKDLMEKVKKEGFDLGVGYDGDSDRIGAIDEKGNIIFGDRLLAIFAKQVLKSHPGASIIFDVKCSKGVVEYIEKLGGKPIMWKTGHSLLKAKLREENAPFAGEMSGHMFFNDRFYGFDDAIYASLRLLEILEEEERKLSELVAEIPFYYSTPEIRVGCPDDRKFEVVKELVDRFKSKYRVIDIDGARIEFDDGFGLVRASNTQPVLVLRFEARTPERLEEIRKIIMDELATFKEIDLSGGSH